MDWDKEEEESGEEKDQKEKEPVLSQIEQLMFNILEEKKNETLMMLMSKLTRKN